MEKSVTERISDFEKNLADTLRLINEARVLLKSQPILTEAEMQEEQRRRRKEKRKEHAKLKRQRELVSNIIGLGYKAMAVRLHPDKGGTSEDMHELQEAKQSLISCSNFKTKRKTA
jgi:DnaJ-domain-containing protein 1